jgi:hypothetical protein
MMLLLIGKLQMITEALISELKKVTLENIHQAQQLFPQLTENQKNWHKDSDSWSINEVFAHLNEFAGYYHPLFQSKIENTRFKEPKDIFISSPLGRAAWKAMKLGNAKNIRRKFKTERLYNPTVLNELVKNNAVQSFESSQNELLKIIDSATHVNLRKVKIPISMSKMIRLRLGDALLFAVYHNERHIYQAIALLNHPQFPKS